MTDRNEKGGGRLYRMIPFAIRHGNCGGSLVQFQAGAGPVNALPFEIGKVLVMSDIRTDDVRGRHAHHATEEILVALSGGCTVELDDGKGVRENVRLSASAREGDEGLDANPSSADINEALLLYPHIWRTMREFDPGTVLMVVANMRYDESDYIRDRAEFEQLAAGWTDLGGSAVGRQEVGS